MLADVQRQQFLEAMGVDVYVLRARAESPVAEIVESAADTETEKKSAVIVSAQPRLVIVCERAHENSREIFDRQHTLILRALGLEAAQIEWLFADATQLEREPPALNMWLVLGEHLARVLGQQLSTQQQNASVIAVLPALPNGLRGGVNKRAFWQALKPVARALRRSAASDAVSSSPH